MNWKDDMKLSEDVREFARLYNTPGQDVGVKTAFNHMADRAEALEIENERLRDRLDTELEIGSIIRTENHVADVERLEAERDAAYRAGLDAAVKAIEALRAQLPDGHHEIPGLIRAAEVLRLSAGDAEGGGQ